MWCGWSGCAGCNGGAGIGGVELVEAFFKCGTCDGREKRHCDRLGWVNKRSTPCEKKIMFGGELRNGHKKLREPWDGMGSELESLWRCWYGD